MSNSAYRASDSTRVLLWVYGVGLAGMMIPYTRDLFIMITPLNLLFAAAYLFYGTKPGSRVLLFGIFIAVTSFLIEAAGVATGAIFGSYHYGSALGPRLLQTPVIIGLNWFILIYCSNIISRQTWEWLRKRMESSAGRLQEIVFTVLTASLLMVCYDLLLEPAAMNLDMWSWEGNRVPFINFSSWFLLSAFYHLIYRLWGESGINRRALPLFVVQTTFFAVIDLFFLLFY
jgi:putative membrane protein